MSDFKFNKLSLFIATALMLVPLTYAGEIGSGQSEWVMEGETSTGSIINGGQQFVFGTATDTTIEAGKQEVYSGTALETEINGGEQRLVDSQASGTTINTGGKQSIESNSHAENTSIKGGEQRISSGSTASKTTIYSGLQVVNSGAFAEDTTLENGRQQVFSNGTVINTTLNGGLSELFSGARAEGYMVVNHQAQLTLFNGAYAEDVIINGGQLNVNSIIPYQDQPVDVEKLTIDGGSVQFGGGDHVRLNIGELNGSGSFYLRTSIADKTGDFISIGQGSGSFGVIVQDSGKEISDHTSLTVNLINDQGGNIDFSLLSTHGVSTRAIDGGAYMYVLKQQTGKDGMEGNVWYLGALTDDENGGNNGNNGGGALVTTPSTDAVLSLANVGLNIIRGEMDSLRGSRQGRRESLQHGEGSVWAHYLGKKSAAETSNGASYKLYQNGMEFGADSVNGFNRGSLVTGGFVSLTGNNVKHARGGTSSVESYGLGAYATWYGNSGFYLDGVAKINRLESKLNARMTNGNMTSGKWHQYGLSAELEAGYTLKPAEYVCLEPFARVTSTYINDSNVALTNGMTALTGKARSLTTEAGIRVGTDFTFSNTTFRPYLDVSVEQELVHSNETVINQVNRINNSQNGTSGKYGAGLTVRPAKDVVLYGGLNYRQGSYVEEPVQGVTGIRISF